MQSKLLTTLLSKFVNPVFKIFAVCQQLLEFRNLLSGWLPTKVQRYLQIVSFYPCRIKYWISKPYYSIYTTLSLMCNIEKLGLAKGRGYIYITLACQESFLHTISYTSHAWLTCCCQNTSLVLTHIGQVDDPQPVNYATRSRVVISVWIAIVICFICKTAGLRTQWRSWLWDIRQSRRVSLEKIFKYHHDVLRVSAHFQSSSSNFPLRQVGLAGWFTFWHWQTPLVVPFHSWIQL